MKPISRANPLSLFVVDSFGGSVYGVLGMVAAIENSHVPVATIVTSKAMSCGFILFALGPKLSLHAP